MKLVIKEGMTVTEYTMIRPAHIKISPCAKLISLRMPYTMVYPMAIRAY